MLRSAAKGLRYVLRRPEGNVPLPLWSNITATVVLQNTTQSEDGVMTSWLVRVLKHPFTRRYALLVAAQVAASQLFYEIDER